MSKEDLKLKAKQMLKQSRQEQQKSPETPTIPETPKSVKPPSTTNVIASPVKSQITNQNNRQEDPSSQKKSEEMLGTESRVEVV